MPFSDKEQLASSAISALKYDEGNLSAESPFQTKGYEYLRTFVNEVVSCHIQLMSLFTSSHLSSPLNRIHFFLMT